MHNTTHNTIIYFISLSTVGCGEISLKFHFYFQGNAAGSIGWTCETYICNNYSKTWLHHKESRAVLVQNIIYYIMDSYAKISSKNKIVKMIKSIPFKMKIEVKFFDNKYISQPRPTFYKFYKSCIWVGLPSFEVAFCHKNPTSPQFESTFFFVKFTGICFTFNVKNANGVDWSCPVPL